MTKKIDAVGHLLSSPVPRSGKMSVEAIGYLEQPCQRGRGWSHSAVKAVDSQAGEHLALASCNCDPAAAYVSWRHGALRQ